MAKPISYLFCILLHQKPQRCTVSIRFARQQIDLSLATRQIIPEAKIHLYVLTIANDMFVVRCDNLIRMIHLKGSEMEIDCICLCIFLVKRRRRTIDTQHAGFRCSLE